MRTLFWRTLVVIFITLGIIGAILPGMPTTVFLILAAWAASKGGSDGCVVVKPPQVWNNPAGLASKWDSTA